MNRGKEKELDTCIGLMDEHCSAWEFESLRMKFWRLLDAEDLVRL